MVLVPVASEIPATATTLLAATHLVQMVLVSTMDLGRSVQAVQAVSEVEQQE